MTPSLCAQDKQETDKIFPQGTYVLETKDLLKSPTEKNKLGKKVNKWEEVALWPGSKAKGLDSPTGPVSRSSPVLLLLIEVSHNRQQAANEGLIVVFFVCLCGQKSASLLCLCQFLLQLDILLSEKHQVLLQLGHLLCKGDKESSLPWQA